MDKKNKDVQFILENLGKYSIETLAKKTGRSIQSIIILLKRITGTSNTKASTGMVTAGELAKIIGVDRNTVLGWMNRHGLPFTRRITRIKKRFTFVEINLFWQWAEKNRDKIDFSRIEKNSLPPEPLWVAKERLENRNSRHYKSWTKKEEQLLIELLNAGKTYQQISESLQRTTCGVKKKYQRMMEA
ncbi:helix-turn-helix domain-containing protein [Bacillus sp. CGMCC 1.16607]|uniref:helix-turn-helix domain-containing protein n=1 Tax=Bacillus sp. CGMCC 1.16607 TaxID=3351842 RepID=UPI00362B5CF6